jgi:hypothetical protein
MKTYIPFGVSKLTRTKSILTAGIKVFESRILRHKKCNRIVHEIKRLRGSVALDLDILLNNQNL